MAETIGRTFYFPRSLWAKLDEDAARCRRSSTKQLEAILLTLYNVEDVELDKSAVEDLGELAPNSKRKLPFAEAGTEPKTKRKKA